MSEVAIHTKECSLCGRLCGGTEEQFKEWISHTEKRNPDSNEYRTLWACSTCCKLIKKIVEEQ